MTRTGRTGFFGVAASAAELVNDVIVKRVSRIMRLEAGFMRVRTTPFVERCVDQVD
jgi:hypothetical protein